MQDQSKNRAPLWPVIFSAICLTTLVGCFPEAPPASNRASSGSGSGGTASMGAPDAGGGAAPTLDGKCLPVTATLLTPRASIIANDVQPTQKTIYVSEVFNAFKVQCGACHVEASDGDFKVSSNDYVSSMRNSKILERIQTDVLKDTMPQPSNLVYADRAADDPVRKLVTLLEEWKDAGFPADVFYEKLAIVSGQNPYAMSAALALALTNIGSCMPEKTFPFATDRATMQALDEKFAALQHAEAGSMAAPEAKLGLPLDLADTDLTSFDSDVLARQGLIAFQPAYPLWSDDSGKLRYVRVPLGKSIRFDATKQQFDIPENTRFYKTFLKEVIDSSGNPRWRKIETRLIVARPDLVTADGAHTPQALFGTYEWDETETHATLLIDTLRNGDPFTDHLFEYVTDEPTAAAIQAKKPRNLTFEYEDKKIIRHYAVPGSNRCIQCHMGGSGSNFVIGFTPLQINRRPLGDGGVYEAPSEDELGQLQHLIDLGVITGVGSASDIAGLESSQGDRAPRNAQELKAQAYMLANCAHCHNLNGYPSVASPVLKPLLNFYPGKDSGIFQFPLERFSPRIAHGYDGSQIPYITPSLRDIMPADSDQISPLSDYVPKFSADPQASPPTTVYLNAPWRSLIYRNVQTAFTYADALTLYPHMPFNTAGHDCRASQWFGEWMVSIPAVRKHPEINENNSVLSLDPSLRQDTEPQPYSEVLPGTPGYDAAVAAAKKRLTTYKNDAHYSECPDTTDIVDPDVPGRYPYPVDKNADGVPDHPNWVVTDLTERQGLWQPRRTDWQDVLVNKPNGDDAIVQTLITSVALNNVAGFADTKFPLGLWKQKPGCKFDSQRTVSSFIGTERLRWFDKNPLDPNAPVYSVLPGQAVFDMICINCHGPNADSLGRQADTLQNLTGGLARVANFRFGLFNPGSFDDPYDDPDRGALTNRQRVFGPAASASASVDDWGARYLSWMALGGTQVHLPTIILDQVRRTDVAGQPRPLPFNIQNASANMLQVAQVACLEAAAAGYTTLRFDPDLRMPDRDQSPLITSNGDAALWTQLCNFNNPSPVHKIRFNANGPYVGADLYSPEFYPTDAFVGDDLGNIVQGVHAGSSLERGNYFPWCLEPAAEDTTREVVNAYAHEHAFGGRDLPVCPLDMGPPWATDLSDGKLSGWQNRGAINAGLSVFVFLDQFIQGKIPHIGYDECEKLGPAN